ncbi:MAG: OmpA family protein [Thermodesulfovibrionales bacterium]|nr:OmpA family protein [Thermodesulfovibrionales bacterium]
MNYFSRKNMLSINKSEEGDQNWLITLSDFLTLLLVFFIMFYMMTKNNNKEKTITEDKRAQSSSILETNSGKNIDKITNNLNDSIRKLNLDAHVSAVNVNNEIVITMKEKILFKPADAWLLDEAYPSLHLLAEIIRNNSDFLVEIEGHTDNIPIHNKLYPSNWELSMARAISVLRYFTEYEGIDASRFSVKGNADNKPIANNDINNRAYNRRVEIKLKEPIR